MSHFHIDGELDSPNVSDSAPNLFVSPIFGNFSDQRPILRKDDVELAPFVNGKTETVAGWSDNMHHFLSLPVPHVEIRQGAIRPLFYYS